MAWQGQQMPGQGQQMPGQGQQMPGQGQQMPGQGQQTIIVLQAPGGGGGQRGRQFQPEMKRGTEFCGHHIKGPCISCMAIIGVLGIIFSLQGITMMQFNQACIAITILGFPLSVTCLVMGCCAGRKAKREWDALPLDHPDRIKYCGIAALTVPMQQQAGGYNVPPGNYPQPSPGGYNQAPGNYNQPPSGAYNPPPFGYNQPAPGPYNQPPGGSGNYSYQSGQPLPPGQPGASPIKYHFQGPAESASAPPPPGAEDPPPSYDQIKT